MERSISCWDTVEPMAIEFVYVVRTLSYGEGLGAQSWKSLLRIERNSAGFGPKRTSVNETRRTDVRSSPFQCGQVEKNIFEGVDVDMKGCAVKSWTTEPSTMNCRLRLVQWRQLEWTDSEPYHQCMMNQCRRNTSRRTIRSSIQACNVQTRLEMEATA